MSTQNEHGRFNLFLSISFEWCSSYEHPGVLLFARVETASDMEDSFFVTSHGKMS